MHTWGPLLSCLLLPLLAACGASSSTSTVGPTSARCAVSVQASAAPIASGGGTGAITVDTARECQWTATAEVPWLTLMSSTSGQGSGSLPFSAAPNRTTATRVGAIAVNGQRVEIAQEAGTCDISVAPATLSTGAAGGELHVAVTTQEFCSWTAVPRVSWIVIASGNGTGTSDLTITATANSGPARSGIVDVAGRQVVVSQAAAAQGCSYAIGPSSLSASGAGQSATVAVTATANCPWSAISEVAWIAVTGAGGGTGSGNVTLTIAANPGGARSGIVTIAGQPFTITQEAGTPPPPQCTYAVSPLAVAAPAGGGPSTLTVTAGAGCSWTLAGAPSWIAVSGGTGSGNGTINLTVSANTGAARTATLTLAGQSIAVTQAGAGTACTYALNPTSLSPTAAGGSSTVAVTTPAGCTWATSGAPAWITVTGGSGTGNGLVTLAVAANTGAARTATLTIAGQAFAVTQAAAGTTCTYAINPTSASPTAAGGSTSVAVTTAAACTWTTSGAPSWITVTGGSGTGNGSVTVAVAANTGAARTATLTIAGQSFTVTQAAACAYSINPVSFSPTEAGGSATVAVTTTAACTWTTSGAPSWITVTGGSGTGNGSVTVAAAANTGAARTATLTIAGQTFTVTQAAAPCSFVVSPTSIQAPKGNSNQAITVTTASYCTWTAAVTSGGSWLTITSGSSDNGNGTVNVGVASNNGAARTGTLLVAGKVVTINQDAR